MIVDEKGVLPGSDYYFPSAGSLAKSIFFYPVCIGEFICDGSYNVERECYNSFLLMYIADGSGSVSSEGKTYIAESGSIVLLDCYKPHRYDTKKGWHTLWLHLDGSNSRAYFDLLHSKKGCVIPAGSSLAVSKLLLAILEGYRHKRPIPEPIISCHIQRILSELLLISSEGSFPAEVENSPIAEAIGYIGANYAGKINLTDVSSRVNLSPFHFSRQFRKETGYSPYEYLIKIRLEHAKQLLKNTKLQVKEIASACGFLSESNFVFSFHKNVGISPREFRNTPF
jgi:AraC family transcriptional regulator